ncbi:serine hydrolase [Streptomyces bauhiniae]|uniref:Serine hydrolase n=1 Tax=Streptomyces bauhiniae TaxID=2340725 RepID=A0A7K3QSL8_9ACTN|nr:serine hydrolase [Streptomyces bauhiniae]NEB92853.1 serine hydrolase [Streptomyces bauhiniae]
MESSRGGPGRRRRTRRRPILSAALVALVIGGVTAGGTVYVKARAHDGGRTVSSPVQAVQEEASVEPVTRPAVDRTALLGAAMQAVDVPSGAAVSAAVLDLDSGESAVYGEGAFDTASIVKVDILAALLLRAQDGGRHLTAAEKAYAVKMIESSDNASATALWDIVGGAEGLDAANARFGLTGTSAGTNGLWGLTRTTAKDQLTLLRQVFNSDSKLTSASRAYLRELMESVDAGQRWGVSAAAGGGVTALKNGWLPRSTTGLWVVNSIGRVEAADGSAYLVAVLSRGTTTQADGVSLVESAARGAVRAFADPA